MNEVVMPQEKRSFRSLLPAKGRAVAVHLSISLAIFLVLLYFILVKWFPQPFFKADGGWQGIRLIFAVDMVLGPLLTFIVFNPFKPRREIVTDLSVIAAVQMAALVWGIHTVHSQRPLAIVERDGVFFSVVADDFALQPLAPGELAKYDAREPAVVFQREPDSEEALKSIRMKNEGTPLSAQTFLYAPFRDHLAQVSQHAAAFEARISSTNPEIKPHFARLRERHGQELMFLPFEGRFAKSFVALTPQGEIVDALYVK